MNNFTRFCLRCGAWDDIKNECNIKECTHNCFLKSKGKNQDFNCKLQRYEYNIKNRVV